MYLLVVLLPAPSEVVQLVPSEVVLMAPSEVVL